MGYDYAKLKEPFAENEIEWRVAQAGKTRDGKVWAKVLAYITARAIQDRFDDVFGPENWKVSYHVLGGSELTSGVLCDLSVKTDSGWVSKQDGAEQTDIESVKGGISSALKRAAVLWGCGRYLYDLEEGYATIVEKGTKGSYYGKLPEKAGGDQFHWLPPRLPAWATPGKNVDSNSVQVPPGAVAGAPKKQGENGPGVERDDPPNAASARDLEDLKSMMVKRQQFGWTYDNLKKYIKAAYDRNVPQELTVEMVMDILVLMEQHTCAMAFAKLNSRRAG